MKTDERNIELGEFIKEMNQRLPSFQLNMFRLGENFVKPKTLSEWIELFTRWNNS